MASKLALWGAGGHARVVADILCLRGEYEIVGFLDDVNTSRRQAAFCGAVILGGREQLDILRENQVDYFLVAVGDCGARLRLAELVQDRGFRLATAIHPRSVVAADVSIAAGTVVTAGAVVNPGARLGENVIVNTCASVDHDCVIADGAHISPGAHLAGGVTIGRGTWIGIGAVIKEGIQIGDGAVIGAGSVVLRDIPSHVVAYGSPANIIRSIRTHE